MRDFPRYSVVMTRLKQSILAGYYDDLAEAEAQAFAVMAADRHVVVVHVRRENSVTHEYVFTIQRAA